MIKLDIGCGVEETKKKGYLGVDWYTDAADVKAKMWELPYKDGEVDEIYSAQALEHVAKYRVMEVLTEWKRVLKIGGTLELRIPDLEWACMWWLRHQSTSWDMDIIYGTQKHDGEFHKTGFTPKIIWDYFAQLGGFRVHSIEFDGGDTQLAYENDAIVDRVNQRIIILKATRIDSDIIEKDDATVAEKD